MRRASGKHVALLIVQSNKRSVLIEHLDSYRETMKSKPITVYEIAVGGRIVIDQYLRIERWHAWSVEEPEIKIYFQKQCPLHLP
jgi:hypothetical protein